VEVEEKKGLIYDIKRDCSEDGPGIRTVIFFKGCPLSCIWCHNPEGISPRASVSYAEDRCNPGECGGFPCVDACETKALTIDYDTEKIKVDRDACTRCDNCFQVCKPKALESVGNWWGVDDLVKRVLIDRNYFRSTGGGVTLSGGEPTLQMEFLHRLLIKLKKEGINIGLETCGMFNLEQFKRAVLPYLDFIYFDLKLIDSEESRKYTGCSNEIIIKNFLFLYHDSGLPIIPRIPLIPDITTTDENLRGIRRFLEQHGVKGCSLMPYNPIWHGKAIKNGLDIKYSRTGFMSKAEVDRCVQYLSQTGKDSEEGQDS